MPPQVITVRNASKVASALANEKCQKILEYLGKHEDATETQLSKTLGIPLSTVHYNMKVLADAHLVLGDQYTYSSRGKEVTHYRVNKNPIVIIQEEQQLDLLKAIAPAALLAAGIGVAWSLLHGAQNALTAAPQAAGFLAEAGSEAAQDGAVIAMKAAPAAAPSASPDLLPWFLAGVTITLALSFAVLAVYRWWNTRQR